MDDYGINVAKFLYDEALARAEAAEATVRELALSVRALFARAEAAEADNAKLREQMGILERALRNTQDSLIANADRADRFKAEADELHQYLNQRRDFEAELRAESIALLAQVAALTAELERLHVGLSKLQDGMPDYLDEAVQALIDNSGQDGG